MSCIATCLRISPHVSTAGRTGRLGHKLQVRMAYSSACFEVFGRVQGVWFRAHTVDKARQLEIVGWCQNTRNGTVKGEIQGKRPDVEEMKVWLATEGSPMSHIERCEFTNERDDLEGLEYTEFGVARQR